MSFYDVLLNVHKSKLHGMKELRFITEEGRVVPIGGPGQGAGGAGSSSSQLSKETRDKLREYSESGSLKYMVDITDYHSGQTYGDLYAFDKETDVLMGYIEFSIYEKVPYIDFIKVRETETGKGFGKMLVARFQSDYSKPVEFGMTTTEGSHLYDSYMRLINEITEKS